MQQVAVIGGGTGSFTILSGLKNHRHLQLASIVAMCDDGGSTGVLRDELGALPPGDTRQCLVALSESDEIWRELFKFRFSEGGLSGQNFGNLFITALEKITGSFEEALVLAGKLLQAKGEVIPVTLDDIRLTAITTDGCKIVGEHNIDKKDQPIASVSFDHQPEPNPKAIRKILQSDMIVICPGDIYTSILPIIMIRDIADAIRDSKAVRVYICNLMTQANHTSGFRVINFVEVLEKYLGQDIFEFVVFNDRIPGAEFLKAYSLEGEYPVEFATTDFIGRTTRFIGDDIISEKIPQQVRGDKLKRALIRHNPHKVASILVNLLK